MKQLLTATVLLTGVLSVQAQTMIDTARVRSAEPQYETTRVPRQECTNRWQPEQRGRHSQVYQEQDQYQNQDAERRFGGAIVGGLAGGVLGNQVGGGNGKVAATAIGAVLGALAGDHLDNRNVRPAPAPAYPAQVYQTSGREVNRCQTVYETQSQLTGYQVVYEYRGQNYSTFMRNNPGNRLKVRVSVEPIQE